MKLVLFNDYMPALLTQRGLVDLSDVVGASIMAMPGLYRMTALIERWEELRGPVQAAEREGAVVKGETQLRAPQPRPSKMVFAAANYNEGIEGIQFPLDMFLKPPSAILDPGGTVVLPEPDAQLFFHEAELGLVIGRRASRVGAADAMNHVFGYTGVIDVSAFGLPGVIGGLRNKGFDGFCPLGPCIVTRDEIADPHRLDIRLTMNGAVRQAYNSSDMEHPIPELVSWASAILTLEAGDIIACGTNHHGIGAIQHGETMQLNIEGIGSLTAHVEDPQRRRWPTEADDQLSQWVTELKTTGKPPTAPLFRVKRIA